MNKIRVTQGIATVAADDEVPDDQVEQAVAEYRELWPKAEIIIIRPDRSHDVRRP